MSFGFLSFGSFLLIMIVSFWLTGFDLNWLVCFGNGWYWMW